MSTARLFVALELPASGRAALARWGSAAAAADPALRAVDEDALHVTVHFLGDRPQGQVEALRAVIAGAPDTAVPLRAAGPLWLAPRRPHVLTLGLEDRSGALAGLHRVLGPLLAAASQGWNPDERPLRPHVTVARVRRGSRPRCGAEPEPPKLAAHAVALVLVRSHLHASGARYEALERRPLQSAD